MAEGGAPDCDKQKNEIGGLIKSPLKKGQTWYLLDNRWFKQWKKYVGYDSWDTYTVGDQTTYPGPIDNSPLLREDGILKANLIDELDYTLVPEEAWNLLTQWYGTVSQQQPIARNVVEFGMFVKHCKVEVYLVELKLCQNSDLENPVVKQFSKGDAIDTIEKEMRRVFNISDDKETRLWNKYMSNTYELLSKKDHTLQDAGLYEGQVLVIEQQNDDGSWPRTVKTSSFASTSTSLRDQASETRSQTLRSYGSSPSSSYGGYMGGYRDTIGDFSSQPVTQQPGICGLSNLGNTCFMNSALQCMSNTQPITQYFLDDRHLKELNKSNPLGMHGEIAIAYGQLTKQIWSGRFNYTVPRDFKVAVGRFAPQFSGFQQHDSQELLAFLLDGLHEDLNRIKKKPYIELRDADGRPDEEVAREAWHNYRQRNDSIIVDTFHGLLKSTLVCPECSKISVTFDPFCYLSLPLLPVKRERQLEVFLMSLDPLKKPIQYKLSLPKLGRIQDICDALSKLTNVQSDKMIVCDVYNSRFHKIFGPQEALSHILDRDDIFVYEVPVAVENDPETVILYLYSRQCIAGSWSLFGQPMILAAPRKNCTFSKLYNLALEKMRRYVRIPDKDDDWWNSQNSINEMDNEENWDVDSSPPSPCETPERLVNGVEEDQAPLLFDLTFVNSYGTTTISSGEVNGVLDFTKDRRYLSLDWNTAAKKKFFNDKAAEEIETDASMNQSRLNQRKAVIQLNDCIELFTTTEELGADDPWYCPRCKKHQQATKKFDLWSLPQILVIHLKRFSYNRYWRDKLDTLVEFPVKLNMSKFVINPVHPKTTYDLTGVINHYGGMGGGHYTAYAKNKDDNNWYYFDDSSVSPSNEDAVVSKAAYVLFYQRRDNNTESHATPSSAAGAPDSNNALYDDEEESMDIN